MPNDTQNALTDFDLCLALAQQAINSQMEYAWKAWKKRNNFQDRITIFKTMRNGKIVDAKTGLTAKVSPIAVDLNVPDAKLAQVRVTLSLESGKVKFFDESTEEYDEYAFEDWAVSFIADLDRKPVDLNILRTIDPDTHRTADAVIRQSGLPESVFSIEYLFMKFTNVDLMLSDNKNIHIPAIVPRSARDKALSSLNFLLQGELGDFLLGTVVRRNARQSTPTFALTDFVFNVHPYPPAPQASTLAYLGMLANSPMPANLTIARTKLEHPWLRSEMIDGTEESVSGVMAISKNVFMGKYLMPKFTSLVGVQPAVSNLTWTYTGKVEKKQETRDLVERDWEFGVDWHVAMTIQSGSNKIGISGRVAAKGLMDGYTLGMRGKSAFHSEWIHMEGHVDLTGSVELVGSDIGADFKLTPKLTYKFENIVLDNNSVVGGAKVLEALGQFLKMMDAVGETPAEGLSNVMQKYVKNWSDWLEGVFKQFDVNLKQHAFIPPGGGVFTFSKPRFTTAGDLIWNVIYIAP